MASEYSRKKPRTLPRPGAPVPQVADRDREGRPVVTQAQVQAGIATLRATAKRVLVS